MNSILFQARAVKRRDPVVRPHPDPRRVVSIDVARIRRGQLLLQHEQFPNQAEEQRAWNDRPRDGA